MYFLDNKFKSILHFIINKYPLAEKEILFVILYFIDFNYFEANEKPLTGEIYIKKDFGVIPTHFEIAIFELIQEKKVAEFEKRKINSYSYSYKSIGKVDLYCLNQKEIMIAKEVCNKFLNYKKREVIRYLKGDMPWILSEIGNKLDYFDVFYRDLLYSVIF